jgi:hypothetical protein
MHALLLILALNFNADLTAIATEVPKTHPNPFRTVTREAFLADVEQLRARAPRMQPHEVIVDMARIVATVGDGHTRMTFPVDDRHGLFHRHLHTPLPQDSALHFHVLPVRFVLRSDGLFTEDGRRVTRIGAMSAEEAIAAIAPVAHADNEWQRKDVIAGYLPMVEVLHARRVIESLEKPVTITYADGQTVQLSGTVHPPVDAASPATPLVPWRFEYLEKEKAVYFAYEEVLNTKEEMLSAFAARMFRFIDEHPVEKLVIDLRENYGGNGSLNRSLLHGLIRAKKLQAPGSVYVLVGRRTFSAAMMFVLDLEQHTNAIFIGEPTGSAPNTFGDSKKTILPDSGLTLRVSSLYWQSSDPRDERDALKPHVYVEPSLTGDAALATALDYFGAPVPLAGKWSGVVSIDFRRIPFTIEDGRITAEPLGLANVPLEQSPMPFALRAGTKRLAGMMSLDGKEFLVTGVPEWAGARVAGHRQ